MITNQTNLDRYLDRSHTIQVQISQNGPIPHTEIYANMQNIDQTGFTFTPRQLLHAIGCKTAALPTSKSDECIKAALLYTNILDLEGEYLSFQGDYGSDLQTARSQEIGIGFMCLIAERFFGIPWDQLGSLPGQGMRFDYRGVHNALNCIFEAKGTSYPAKQRFQIRQGLEKKVEHHRRGEHFDVELIVSTYIGRHNGAPRILLADPDKNSLKDPFNWGDARYYRLKHYCRVLQFIGLPDSAYLLNRYIFDYLNNRQSVYKTINDEKRVAGFLTSIIINNDRFLGRWFSDWLPKDSKRYKKLQQKEKSQSFEQIPINRRVFQGVRQDIFESGFDKNPFSHSLLDWREVREYKEYDHSNVSVFPDGTIMIFEQK